MNGFGVAEDRLDNGRVDVSLVCPPRRDTGGRVSEGAVSQNLLCFANEVTVENACPHLSHLICNRQSACILL